uniref:Neurotransmitter-gated ion-channel ligand-binding domain-containing protein n=1 Tax=Plectus sambesii TaxID=2011161 RepID=A0A914XK07_9BILA
MLLLLTVILSCALCSRPFVSAYETRLINKLLLNYDKRIRPVKNSSHAVEVTIEPQIYSLIDVDELHEILKILLWLPQGWTDENLSWDPSEWDNITLVNVPASELWMPDGYIFNTIEIREALSLSQIYARVDFNGMVEVDLSKVISVRCPLDLISFPFDTQNCSLQFGSWGYQAHQLTHIVRNTFVLVNNQNSEWDIVSFSAKKTKTWYKSMHNQSRQFEEIFYTLSIKRKPLYYIVVLVVPSFLIANICLVGLFTPNSANGEREEKVTLGLTTLLTMAVVLNIVAGEMPKSSTGLPLLGTGDTFS